MLRYQSNTEFEISHHFIESLNWEDSPNSDDPQFLNNAAMYLAKTGEIDAAIDCYRKLVAIDARHVDASNNLGHLLIRKGCFEEAASILKQYLKSYPEDLLALTNSSQAHVHLGQYQEARSALERMLSLDPKRQETWCNLGNVHCKLGHYDLAVNCYKQYIDFQPDDYRAYRSLGDAFQCIGRSDDAAQAYAYALKIQPDDPDIIASLSLALTNMGKKEQALICYQKALLCRPNDYTLQNQYATVLEKCNRLEEARAAIERSLSSHPNNFGAMVNLATIEYREGQFDIAHSLLKGLDLSGRTYEAAATIKQLEGLALDKLGRYSEAFNCFQQSNRFDRQTPTYKYLYSDYKTDLNVLSGMATRFSKNRISSWTPFKFKLTDNSPVFLVGFPRSGTTLMEQVLNAHPQIKTLDEQTPLGKIVEDFTITTSQAEQLDGLSTETIKKYRNNYFALLEKRTEMGDGDHLIIDKLPLNILYLPVIYRFFPNAKIIVALRHPLDCILSNFIQRFRLNKKMMNFLTLKNTANFYDLTMGTYLQFRQSVPLPMHEIRYEALTENLEDEAKTLAGFLNLEWSPDMMHFYQKAANRIINTPSYREVIKPIHRKAVYRWRNYRAELVPIIPIVKKYIDRFGYDLDS
jgi:tetratricopeptide (TPR) repeat protein